MKSSFTLTRRLLSQSLSKVARVAMCLLAAAVLGAGAASEASACSMPTRLPQGPFMNQSSDYRMRASGKWGDLHISPKTTLEFGALFSPIPNYSNSRILGPGWSFPLFESTALLVNDREIELKFPSGSRERLKRAGANQFKGSGWRAISSTSTANGGQALVVKSTCGWELRYQAGRLKMLKTPDGATTEFKNDAQGNHWILANGKSVLTLKPDYDATTQKVYHLNVQGGRHAILRFGTRPVMVKTTEKDLFGSPKEKKQEAVTLRSVQWDGEPEKKYEFGLNEMNVAGRLYKWAKESQKLI